MVRRIGEGDLPNLLAVFPLEGVLLLPRANLPLNIFEPRYLAMIDDALRRDHRLIGMVQPRNSQSAQPSLYEMGCAGRITSFSETEDGRYLIALTGICRFRIRAEVESFAPFRRIEPHWLTGDLNPITSVLPERSGFLVRLRRYFEQKQLAGDWSEIERASDEVLINALSMLLPFTPSEKQMLLEAPDLVARFHAVDALIGFGESHKRLQ